MIVDTYNRYTAHRAIVANEKPGRVFYLRGGIWHVVGVAGMAPDSKAPPAWRIVLESARRSLDDCTVAEWKAATKMTNR